MSSAAQPQKTGMFGERLRREREMRGIKLEEISESTKIGKRNLVALEEEHFDQLPGGIFNKGFVRAYARYLGLDEEQAVADFLAASANYEQPAALAPPPTSVVKAPAMPSEAATARRQRLWALLAALALVIVLGYWFRPGASAIEKFRPRREAGAVKPMALNSEPARSETSSPADAQSSLVVNENSSLSAAQTQQPTAKSAQAAGATLSATSSPEKTAVQTAAQSGKENLIARKSSSSDGILLDLHATSEVWVSALSDGVSVLNLTLQAGDTRQLRAYNHLILRTGNAGALELSFNGKPLAPVGKPNQVRTLTFTPSGLQ